MTDPTSRRSSSERLAPPVREAHAAMCGSIHAGSRR